MRAMPGLIYGAADASEEDEEDEEQVHKEKRLHGGTSGGNFRFLAAAAARPVHARGAAE